MLFNIDMDTIIKWFAGSGSAERLRLHEWQKELRAAEARLVRKEQIRSYVSSGLPGPRHGFRAPAPTLVSVSPTETEFRPSTSPVQNIWTSRHSCHSAKSSCASLYIAGQSSNAAAEMPRMSRDGAQSDRNSLDHLRSSTSERDALTTGNVPRNESAKSFSSIRSNASTDTIQHILENDSGDMRSYGRWRHHRDVSIEWLENKIREDFKGPGAYCLFGGNNPFAVSEHPLVEEYLARKRAQIAEREASTNDLTRDVQESTANTFQSTTRKTASSVSLGKDGRIVQTGFLTRTESVGSTLTSSTSSGGSFLEMPPTQKQVPTIMSSRLYHGRARSDVAGKKYATGVNLDVELSASLAVTPISRDQAEQLKQAVTQFSQGATYGSFLSQRMDDEQRQLKKADSVIEDKQTVKERCPHSDHVHFAKQIERRCIIVKPEDAENAIESDDEECELRPVRSKTPPLGCSKPVKSILKRPSNGSGVTTPAVSTPGGLSPSASSKPLSMTPAPWSCIQDGYDITANAPANAASNAMGKKRKSVEFAPKPQIFNVPALQRRATQRPRQRGFARRGTAIKAS